MKKYVKIFVVVAAGIVAVKYFSLGVAPAAILGFAMGIAGVLIATGKE